MKRNEFKDHTLYLIYPLHPGVERRKVGEAVVVEEDGVTAVFHRSGRQKKWRAVSYDCRVLLVPGEGPRPPAPYDRSGTARFPCPSPEWADEMKRVLSACGMTVAYDGTTSDVLGSLLP